MTPSFTSTKEEYKALYYYWSFVRPEAISSGSYNFTENQGFTNYDDEVLIKSTNGYKFLKYDGTGFSVVDAFDNPTKFIIKETSS